MRTTGARFSRRDVLYLTSGSLVAGLWPAALPGQVASTRLRDAHVHLFNLTDLPLSGFLKYALLPEWAQNLRAIGIALGGLAGVARSLSTTVDDEIDDRDWDLLDRQRSEQFAQQVSQRIAQATQVGFAARTENVLNLTRSAGPRAATSEDESYLALALALQSTEDEEGLEASEQLLRLPASLSAYERVVNVDAQVIRRATEGEWDPGQMARMSDAAPRPIRRLFEPPAAAAFAASAACPDEPATQTNGGWAARTRATLGWVDEMGASRHTHLKRYLERIRGGGLEPGMIVNLLVDYDRWIDSEPASKSSHEKQIHFWNSMAVRQSARVDIRTFAGFDPLKHAEDRLKGQPGYWNDLKRYFLNSKTAGRQQPAIWGFKLYPPMGFRPIGNLESDFATDDQAMRIIRRRWSSETALQDKKIHEELDRSLQEFYAFCRTQGAPVLAHARHGNAAGRCWGSRADPAGWRDVVTADPRLRLCLGHFAEAADFIDGMKKEAAGEQVHSRVWALHGLRDLLHLNRTHGTQVYADIGYMSEFLIGSPAQGEALAAEFFRRLGQYCLASDERCEHLMFGSDWIMLDREIRDDRYVQTILGGLERAGWAPAWKDNFLRDNLGRFLSIA